MPQVRYSDMQLVAARDFVRAVDAFIAVMPDQKDFLIGKRLVIAGNIANEMEARKREVDAAQLVLQSAIDATLALDTKNPAP